MVRIALPGHERSDVRLARRRLSTVCIHAPSPGGGHSANSMAIQTGRGAERPKDTCRSPG